MRGPTKEGGDSDGEVGMTCLFPFTSPVKGGRFDRSKKGKGGGLIDEDSPLSSQIK
jgi:hypothetical protein